MLAKTKYKVESGIQLLARLQRKPDLENFYPVLFEDGPKPNEVIEIYIEEDPSFLLMDLITQAILPAQFGGMEAGVLIYNTDGHMNFNHMIEVLRKKIVTNSYKLQHQKYTEDELNNFVHQSLTNLSVLEIYDATQLYASLHSLEKILLEKTNISLILFDTLTAFYWSEQGFKIIKMDMYLKNLLKIIEKITKECKITILYTRPEYFSSSKSSIENLEVCAVPSMFEQISYKIHLLTVGNGSYQVNVKTCSKFSKKYFKVIEDLITWL